MRLVSASPCGLRVNAKPLARHARGGEPDRGYTESKIMAQQIPNPPPGFDELTFDEKLDYVQSLWVHIAANSDSVPIPDWHLDLIEERLRVGRGTGRAW